MPFLIKQNDTLPWLQFQFREADNVTPLDLTLADTVYIVVRPTGQDPDDPPTFKKPCVVDNALTGTGHFVWTQADTATVGQYDYEFEITWDSGGIQTIPVDGYLDLRVIDDIG